MKAITTFRSHDGAQFPAPLQFVPTCTICAKNNDILHTNEPRVIEYNNISRYLILSQANSR